MNKEKSKNRGLMTEGVIWKELLLFSIPLLLGNLFQQLYNAVDSVVVGNYIGAQALAAVGFQRTCHQSADQLFHGPCSRSRRYYIPLFRGTL